ncbi:thioesterase family protein [Streptomyces corynorhini]|uniref:Thioesterase family protein n=1 Tax=Streptomyces corynorhini TaxID=2282652 RepID=A0A370BC11_9ACTN|nr:thioesterase family protein [Streptomyces corynorhini]RDG37246.1 thioesterase family protein [Streptomyces corynorhini]
MAQVSIGDSEFDRETAVVPREPGVYDVTLSPGWTVMRVVNGGYLLAVVGRALGDALPHPDPIAVSAHYLSPSVPGPAVIRTETVRSGRTLSTGQASVFQPAEDGGEVERIRVLASYGDLDALPDDTRTTAKPPAIPPRERCLDAAEGPVPPGDFSLMDRLDLRMDPDTVGWAVGEPSGRGSMRAWFDLADGRAADPLSLLLTVDALPPAAFDLGLTGWTPTVELTAHVRCRPAPGPLRVALATRNLAGGFLEEDAEVWDSADRLVAQSRQLARAPRG